MLRPTTARAHTAAALAALIALSPSLAAAQALGQLYIEVRDREGQPATGLTPADFSVSEGDAEATVVSADPVGPMKIALLVDNGDRMREERALSPLRNSLTAFLDTLAPEHEVFLATIGRHIQRRVDFTTDREELKDGAGSIFFDQGAGTVVLDGIRETWDRRFEDDEPFPVFVMVLSDGTESSSNYDDDEYTELVEELIANEVAVHSVLLTTRGGSLITQLSMNMAQNTGGMHESILAATALEDSMTNLANRLNTHAESVSARYRVVYEPPDPRGASISASVERFGVEVVGLFSNLRMAQ
jgi:hypothetical protein